MRKQSTIKQKFKKKGSKAKRPIKTTKQIKPVEEETTTEAKPEWKCKRRVLALTARGLHHRDRHLLNDLKSLMPHQKSEPKMERWKTLSVINEMAEMKNCNKAILFEGRRKKDLYVWLANTQAGPSAKFLIESISTMGELRLIGNCLRGSRPLLSFDQSFTKEPFLAVIRELLVQIFGVPKGHPKSQPFLDRVYNFSYLDKRIWFRHYQILSEDGALNEIGPRFVMNPIKVFESAFSGATLWENDSYISPAKYRQMLKKNATYKYLNRSEHKLAKKLKDEDTKLPGDEFDEVYQDAEFKEKAMKLAMRAAAAAAAAKAK